MRVDVEPIVHWSARVVGAAMAAYFALALVREALVAAEAGTLASLTAADYLGLSLVWIAGIGLLVGWKWPFFGGFLTLVAVTAALILLVLRGAAIHPAIALVGAAGALYVLDGALARRSSR